MLFAAVALCIFAIFGTAYASIDHYFTANPEPIVAPPGDEVTFECQVNVPADQVRWRHGTKFLPRSHGEMSHNHTTRGSHLKVKVEDSNQAGDYQCVASYGASVLVSVSAKLTLAELHQFPKSNSTGTKFSVSTGNTVSLHCEPPYSSPPAFVQYYKDGKPLPETVMTLASTNSLVLSNVKSRDSGRYGCSATNYITGQTVTLDHLATLTVQQPQLKTEPHFLFTPPSNYTTRIGQNATLECAAVGEPVPHVTWRRYGGSLPQDRAEMIPGGLTIRHIKREDEGTYVCELNNGVGKPLTHVAMLYIYEPPSLQKEPKSPIRENEGGELNLECVFSGSPVPDVTWLINGESLDNVSHARSTGGKLRITQLEKRYSGIVQCFGTNVLGTSVGAALLHVHPKQVTAPVSGDLLEDDLNEQESEEKIDYLPTTLPVDGRGHRRIGGYGRKGRRKYGKNKGNADLIPASQPNVTRLTDTSVMVRWSVPEDTGLPIQFFKVQHREVERKKGHSRSRSQGKNSRWMTNNEDIAPHIRSYEVDGLEPDHTYRFRIAAVYSNNDNKLGPCSQRFHLHRGSHLKNAPSLVHTQAVGSTVIQIFWQFPMSHGPVDGFYIWYRDTSSAGEYIKATVEGQTTRSYNITHLSPGTMYDIKIQSFTTGSASDFSAILTQRTLSEPTVKPEVPEVRSSDISVKDSTSSNKLYIVLGAVGGGLLLISVIVISIIYCTRRRSNNAAANIDDSEQQDKVNGTSLQIEAVNLFGNGVNGKIVRNGHASHNGYLSNNKINITSNPLSDVENDKMHSAIEMSYISSQNNNCPSTSEASGSGGESDRSVNMEINSAKKCWRATEPSVGEKYL